MSSPTNHKLGREGLFYYTFRNELVECNYTCQNQVNEELDFISSEPFIDTPSSETEVELLSSTLEGCFQYGSEANNAIHKVTLYVDQPNPGTRSPWEPITNVGHAFIGMEQTIDGQTISLVLGFYPKAGTGGNPWDPEAEGVFHNDGSHGYDVSITSSITKEQFQSIRFAILDWNGDNYNLNSANCTHFAIYAFEATGITLPRTYQEWPLGGGLNPGDLGEDLRAMALGQGMTRNTTGGLAPSTTCD